MTIRVKLSIDNKALKEACEKWSDYFETPIGQAEQHIMIYQIKLHLQDKLKQFPRQNDKDND